jgi:hypothetical protein
MQDDNELPGMWEHADFMGGETDNVNSGGPGDIPPVEVKCKMDEFENHIRAIGVVAACEWFGHERHSEFTLETIHALIERSSNQKTGEHK